ncbi:unnamed protein product [Blumeria hordei]|uniref:MYB transcription factor n=2 Tax=Blumeria hordei TaxID=2867405 RepID=A0A383UVH4_BLUHO|nr:MYB DNA-binding domain containing protein [Blumeria hordei DH14]SZF04353.1 unnamed protein product [Blumeria hordei]
MNGSNTIEPHLIALLNDSHSDLETPPSLELPPLNDPNILKVPCRPLLLEPDAIERNQKPSPSSQIASTHNKLPASTDNGEILFKEKDNTKSDRDNCTAASTVAKCSIGGLTRQSLHTILDDNDIQSSSTSKKRHQIEPNMEEFVQLPQPPKKQKATKQVVPPIIIGLFEPPLQATLFPPIASSSFHDSHGRNSLNTIPLRARLRKETLADTQKSTEEKSITTTNQLQEPKKVATRNKWTDDETNQLLLGVHKHGVGCWTDILGDSNFSFNGRSPSDLKDRWRTCCPNELRKKASPKTRKERTKKSIQIKPNLNSATTSENTFTENKIILANSTTKNSVPVTTLRKRSHRKKLEDLAQLGIEGPIRQSNRRERRQFTEDEDSAIIEGYNTYGPAWSKIQKDPKLKLQSRQPTDLRDRFRNKFPDKFRESKVSKNALSVQKIGTRVKETHLPSHETNGRNNESLLKEKSNSQVHIQTQNSPLSREGLRIQEIISSEPYCTLVAHTTTDSAESLSFGQFSDWNQNTAVPFSNSIGEMDISRLLLDENWSDMPGSRARQTYTDGNHLFPANSESLHNFPSFFNMTNDADDLTDGSFG